MTSLIRTQRQVITRQAFLPPDIWSWSFQDGTLGPLPSNGYPYALWNFIPADEVIVPDTSFPANIDGTQYSGRNYYFIDPTETPNNVDRNRSFERQCSFNGSPEDSLEHFFVRWWVKLGNPVNTTDVVDRKLCYIRGDKDFNASWCVIIGGFNDSTGVNIQASGADQDEGITTWVRSLDTPYVLPWNVWKGFECEVQLNTPNLSDGVLRLWIYDTDGSTLRSQAWTGVNLRGSATPFHFLELVQFGNQADRDTIGKSVNEYRYDTRLAISRQRMGP